MATGVEVLQLLCPNKGWVIYGDDYSSINWFDKEPAVTEAEFKAGFDKVEIAKKEAEQKTKDAKLAAEAKLVALGLTIEDLKALGLA